MPTGAFYIVSDYNRCEMLLVLRESIQLKCERQEIATSLQRSVPRFQVHLHSQYVLIMPPQRIRNAFDDSRSEASSTRDRQSIYTATGISKGRRNGSSTLAGSNLKDVTNVPTGQQADAAVSVKVWRMASD